MARTSAPGRQQGGFDALCDLHGHAAVFLDADDLECERQRVADLGNERGHLWASAPTLRPANPNQLAEVNGYSQQELFTPGGVIAEGYAPQRYPPKFSGPSTYGGPGGKLARRSK